MRCVIIDLNVYLLLNAQNWIQIHDLVSDSAHPSISNDVKDSRAEYVVYQQRGRMHSLTRTLLNTF